MIVNSYRHDLLRMLLPHHILIKCCLDLVRCRDCIDIEFRLWLILRFFLLDLLTLWHTAHHILQIRQVDHADARHISHSAKGISHRKSLLVFAHIKTFLHTIHTDFKATHIKQLSCDMFRSVADTTECFIFIVIRLFFGVNYFCILFLFLCCFCGPGTFFCVVWFFIYHFSEIVL